MDNHDSVDRDIFMADKIPHKGNTLVYVGNLHLTVRDGIPGYFAQKSGKKLYSINHIMKDENSDIEEWLRSLLRKSKFKKLQKGKGFGLNLTKNQLHQIAGRHFTTVQLGLDEDTSIWCDGIIYHNV